MRATASAASARRSWASRTCARSTRIVARNRRSPISRATRSASSSASRRRRGRPPAGGPRRRRPPSRSRPGADRARAAPRASAASCARARAKSPAIASSTATKPPTPSSAKRRPATRASSSTHSARACATGTRLTTSAQAMTLTRGIEIDGAAGSRRAKRRAVRASGRPRSDRALHPGELAHQAARPRDADVVAERLERHGGGLGDGEPRGGVHRLGVPVGGHARAFDLAAQAHAIDPAGPPPRPPPAPRAPGC